MAVAREDLLQELTSSEEGRQRLAEAHRYAQVGMCVSSVTHDINNQLGVIMAYAELLAMEHEGDSQLTQMAKEIVEGVKRSSRLLEDLTSVARKARPEALNVPTHDIAQRALDLRLYDIKVAGVRMEQRLDASGYMIVCDRPRLEQALLYLLSNGLEAALESERPSMRFELSHDDGFAVFTVWDSGPGIPENLWESCFDPWVTTKGPPHLGLGLMTARRTAILHEGTLSYDPHEGMRLRVPLTNSLAGRYQAENAD